MVAVCAECKASGEHQPFLGEKPEFASNFDYAVCASCGSIFNTVNPHAGNVDDITDVCETLLSETRIKLSCYIFGPFSSGTANAFDYEYRKRLQLRESLPARPILSKVIEWVRFPEQDLPATGKSPSGTLGQQEMRLIERAKRNGTHPLLIFVVTSPGAVAELSIAATFPESSLLFINARLKNSYVAQDNLSSARLNGAQVFYYTGESGCSLRAFAVDFISEKLADIIGALEAIRRAEGKLSKIGFKRRRRKSK